MSLDITQTYIAVNDLIWNMSQQNIDLIITGNQTGFLAYNDYNAMMFPSYHQIFFSAIQPDAIIVCINPFDDLDFVERTIKAAEGLSGGKVIGIVCFPIDISNEWQGKFGIRTRIDKKRESQIKKLFKEHINMAVYMLDENEELNRLINEIINYFGCE